MLLGACRSAMCCWAVSNSLSIEGWTRHCDTICLGSSAATFHAVSSITVIETAGVTCDCGKQGIYCAHTKVLLSANTRLAQHGTVT